MSGRAHGVVYQRGLAAGESSVMEPSDQFCGDRHGGVKNQIGNCWWIASHIEDVRPDEMQRRALRHYGQ